MKVQYVNFLSYISSSNKSSHLVINCFFCVLCLVDSWYPMLCHSSLDVGFYRWYLMISMYCRVLQGLIHMYRRCMTSVLYWPHLMHSSRHWSYNEWLFLIFIFVSTACDCVVFQSDGASQGRFMSPNFPNIYPRNSNCILYTFIGDLNEIIELTFLEFDLKMPAKGRYVLC